jgi:hypothetical protein
MTENQIADTAMLILEEYPKLKVDDIALFFRKCKMSHFGKLYDLNGMVLMDWLSGYIAERNAVGLSLSRRREEERKREEERRREEEWNALTEEERRREEDKISGIINRLTEKYKA